MRLWNSSEARRKFAVLGATRHAQAAMMTLVGNATSDDKVSNEHPRSEQWLYVISGSGTATVISRRGRRRSVTLGPGSLLVIERGELHQIRHRGARPLRTLNFYVPPAYTPSGEVRPRAKG